MMKKIIIPILTVIIILSVGTVAYHYLEGWTYVDSLFFSTIALTTGISSGLYPKYDVTKLFTVVYIIGGLGTVLFELTQIGTPQLQEHLTKGIGAIKKKFDGVVNNGDDSKK